MQGLLNEINVKNQEIILQRQQIMKLYGQVRELSIMPDNHEFDKTQPGDMKLFQAKLEAIGKRSKWTKSFQASIIENMAIRKKLEVSYDENEILNGRIADLECILEERISSFNKLSVSNMALKKKIETSESAKLYI